jgi:Anti-sigma factor NepR
LDRLMASKELYDNRAEGKQTAAKESTVAGKPRVGSARGLDSRSQEAIGRALKAHYDDLVRAPVPDKFMELLDRLEATEQSGNSQSEADESD